VTTHDFIFGDQQTRCTPAHDHPDDLLDPAAYLRLQKQLQELAGAARKEDSGG
jgi:hypothetical protein